MRKTHSLFLLRLTSHGALVTSEATTEPAPSATSAIGKAQQSTVPTTAKGVAATSVSRHRVATSLI